MQNNLIQESVNFANNKINLLVDKLNNSDNEEQNEALQHEINLYLARLKFEVRENLRLEKVTRKIIIAKSVKRGISKIENPENN